MYSRVLVCISNPMHAEEMVRLAISVSSKPKLVFLRVVKGVGSSSMKLFESDLAFLKTFRNHGKPVNYEMRLAEGPDVVDVILNAAEKEKADLILIGAANHKGVVSKLSGDICSEIMKRAQCAVVAVKSREL